MFNKIFHSENYLGKRKKDCFEGWYFKIESEENICSFIVGISKTKGNSHAFVQYIDCERSYYFTFPSESFAFDKKNMKISLGGNEFSLKGISCDIEQQNARIRADLDFCNLDLFKKSFFSPSIMGPFSFLPLGCNHVVVSMSHSVKGTLEIDGKAESIDGLGYIEKDYGSAFPKNYFWAQGQNENVSVMFALAYPLIFGIKGFLCLISIDGKQYNLSLYSGAKLKISKMTKDESKIFLRKRKIELCIEILGDSAEGFSLIAPAENGKMDIKIKENVSGKMKGYFRIGKEKTDFEFPCAYEFVINKN